LHRDRPFHRLFLCFFAGLFFFFLFLFFDLLLQGGNAFGEIVSGGIVLLFELLQLLLELISLLGGSGQNCGEDYRQDPSELFQITRHSI
jgi:hypothetical protein